MKLGSAARTLTALAFALCSGASLSGQQTFPVLGFGRATCGDLVQSKQGKAKSDEADYRALLQWMQGYLTGVGAERAASQLFWDGLVHAASEVEKRETDLPAARLAYCKDSKDPICSLWITAPIREFRSGSVFRQTNVNALTSWIDRYCAEHPLESFKDAVGALARELSVDAPSKPK